MQRERVFREITDLMQIVYRINRSFSQACPDERELPIPPGQLHALIAIGKRQPLNMTSLAEHLLMTRQQLTRVVDSLAEKGLVERGADPENRRHVILRLTPEGGRYIKELLLVKPNFLNRLLEMLDEREEARFLDAVATIKDVLSKVILEPL